MWKIIVDYDDRIQTAITGKVKRNSKTVQRIKDIFDEWIEEKINREEISKDTRDRYKRQFKQCLDEFGKNTIKDIPELEIKNFILNSIHKLKLIASVIQDIEISKKGNRTYVRLPF